MKCPNCHFQNPEGFKFCGNCANLLEAQEDFDGESSDATSERKHVTILFSDLSGYTAMNERLDPEEVKEIMSRIFGEIGKVIAKYDGFIERFIGDAVMAIFGIPRVHEDDPIRAVRAAMEIHTLVAVLSPELEPKVGRPLSMHTGINTGLVVTGDVDVEKGTHGLIGDSINLASRLEGLAKAGEILVGPETYNQVLNFFEFEPLEPTKVKGKQEPVGIFRLVSSKSESYKLHRLRGLRANLIGRDFEMHALANAVEHLKEGVGSVVSICGDAGTGKSRIKREFKAALDLQEIQWIEGHAYSYSSNVSYFPLINLLANVFQIEERDLPSRIRDKVESNVTYLLVEGREVVPYIGSLFALDYPEVERVSPEYWKDKLQDSIQTILAALIRKKPTIVCFEDLHWADPSFIGLLRRLLKSTRMKALFVCIYRPQFSLFDSDLSESMKEQYREIRLREFGIMDEQKMVQSLLGVHEVPKGLYDVIHQKAEGNPFFIEEIINSLIDSEVLVNNNGDWTLTHQLTEEDIPATIQGVLTARVDRLGKPFKRILQEASVIGRTFLYKILEKITDVDTSLDQYLSGLENLDLIRSQSTEPDLEYVFKHVLTQETVYSGLLKKDRRLLHEKVGIVMEHLFQDRLPEYYETLAFHFKRGTSTHKAVEYLMKSGEKSLKRYAVEESHYNYKQAFDLLSSKEELSKDEVRLLIDLLNNWALVFYYRGDFKTLTDLLFGYERLVESLDDESRKGMFYAWQGYTLDNRHRSKESRDYLFRALEIGEKIGDDQLIGYACTWLTWTCVSLGLLDEALEFGKKALGISDKFESNHYLFLKSLAGMGLAYFFKGETNNALDAGKQLIEFGFNNSDVRSTCIGYYIMGYGFCAKGDFTNAIESSEVAIRTTTDPLYSQVPRIVLGISYLLNEQISKAKSHLEELISFGQKFGFEIGEKSARAFLAVISIAEGQMDVGFKELKKVQSEFLEAEARCASLMTEHVLGKIYLQMSNGPMPDSNIVLKNIGFLVKNIPFAGMRSKSHLERTIDMAKDIGANGILGQAYLDLGLLHKAKKRKKQARECISEAIHIFGEHGADVYMKRAVEALKSL